MLAKTQLLTYLHEEPQWHEWYHILNTFTSFFIYKNRRFFHYIPDAVFDVIHLMSFNAILGCDIFGKKNAGFDAIAIPDQRKRLAFTVYASANTRIYMFQI